ncbi:nucleoside deaminase [bacterium]|nr:nucleoside deaminase [bacterium]
MNNLYMNEALNEAKKAYALDEVPVGAIIVLDGKIIGRGYNERIRDNRISSHAEIKAIEDAEKTLGRLNLEGAEIYVTLEPCPMCSFAIMESHISKLYYGAKDEKRGAISNLDIFNKKLGSKVEVYGNILDEESSELLKSFFKEKR